MFFFYQIIVSIVILFSPIIILIRIFTKKEHPVRFKENSVFFQKKEVQEMFYGFMDLA